MSRASGDLWPEIRLYHPDGHLLRAESSSVHAEIALPLPTAGTYTVLVSDGYNGTLTGDYNLYLQALVAMAGLTKPSNRFAGRTPEEGASPVSGQMGAFIEIPAEWGEIA